MTHDQGEYADQTGEIGWQPPEGDSWELPGDRYQVVGEVGRGGMGVVLRVLDTHFDRPLAIKVLRNDQSRPAAAERRFVDEARITGQLQHPGIPPVHEVGRLPDGRPFFSMKLIEGRTLADLLAKRSSPQDDLPRFLKIFEQIAQTLAYAHSQGVIHRDLKPLNIMVGTFGEVQVMDWGLAKRLAQATSIEDVAPEPPQANGQAITGPEQTIKAESDSTDSNTQAGEVLGTFAYMAPEQARGEVEALSERWDVFGLGAILCIVLTGRPPYEGIGSVNLWRQAQNAKLDAAWERLDACGADPELVALARRCLAPKAEDRPRDAGQVASEMATYLASVQERLQRTRVTQAEAEVQAREERKRRRLAVFLAVAVVVLVVGASGFGLWYASEQARRDRDQTQRDTELATRTQHLNREVAAALDEAARLRDELHARLRDPRKAAQLLSELHQWQSLVESAHAAWKRADTVALSGRDLLSPELRERLATIAGQLQVDEHEKQIAFALDRIRLEASTLVNGQISFVAATPKLAQVFHDAGYQIEADDPAEIASRIRQSTIRLPLVAGLDYWALATEDRVLQARLLEVARLSDPHPWRDRFRQSVAWADLARLKALADEVDFDEQSPQVLAALAQRLSGRLGNDPALVRRALIAHPRDLWLLFQLGMSSSNPVEQAGAFRAALAVRPEAAVIYYNLGVIQQAQQKPDEAAACYRKALVLDPNHAGACTNLGIVLDELRQPDEAYPWFVRAVQLAPKSVTALINLGGSLHARRKFDEAIDCYRKASAIEPRNTALLNNLGGALREKNQLDEAADCYRKALEIDGNNAFAWCNLGHVLNTQGKFDEALKAMRKGHELGSRQPGWTHPSWIWVFQTQARIALDQKLTDVLRGDASPAGAGEQAAMAELCLKLRKRYATALRYYTAAFAAGPKLADDLTANHRYNAACAAALAADAKGVDADELKDDARTAARRQALDWLRADLKARTDLLERKPAESKSVAGTLEHWQADTDLAGVRDAAALAKLPPGEQGAWEQLWAEAAMLRNKAVKGAP